MMTNVNEQCLLEFLQKATLVKNEKADHSDNPTPTTQVNQASLTSKATKPTSISQKV
ncbi:MAG: hypothetical protein KTR14_01170 [Vampirovibrio sp.]|nr:hypothetical protein [Vampirovibrio sp.]